MELHALQSPTLSIIPTSLTPQKSFFHGQAVKFPRFNKCPDGSKLGFIDFRPQVSGNAKFKPVKATSKNVDSKDEDLVFVAGATGKVGSRTVRELLKLGFRVRAGVRSAQRAGPLVQSVNEMKFDTNASGEGTKPVEKLELVECDLEKPDQIGEAIENASVVICCIGASEKEISDVTGPYRIDYKATENLIKAATAAKVDHFIMVSSLGTNKVGFPAAILNLFWGVLIWKRKAEEALIASGIPYTIVRPGGMERPTDAYKETHNITLSVEDTLFGGQVSNLQVAELIAFMSKNRELSCCKVVEVIAETTAPLTPMGDLLTKIPSQRVCVPPPKKVEATTVSTPVPIESVVPEPTITPAEPKPVQEKAKTPRPLSPFAAYEDLKPPCSPIPASRSLAAAPEKNDPAPDITVVNETPSSPTEETGPLKAVVPTPVPPYAASQKEDISSAEAVSEPSVPDTQTSPAEETSSIPEIKATPKIQHLSPYYAYEDLKPPTSPLPKASGPKEVPFTLPTPVEVASPSLADVEVPKASGPKEVPFTVPTPVEVPSPSLGDVEVPKASGPKFVPFTVPTPVEVPSPSLADVNGVKSTSGEKENHEESTHSHSPYHAYEDLKPPTSPVPVPTTR